MTKKSAKRWLKKNEIKIRKINTGLEKPDNQFKKQYAKAVSSSLF
jgi:hypothetical protein